MVSMARIGLFAICVAATVALSGCVADTITRPLEDAASVSAAMVVEADPYKKITTAHTPFLPAQEGVVTLGKVVGSNPQSFAVIYAGSFREWKFLQVAYANGKRYDETRVDREVGHCSSSGCSVTESVIVALTRDDLVNFLDKGIVMKIEGQRGAVVFDIPAHYVRAVLDYTN